MISVQEARTLLFTSANPEENPESSERLPLGKALGRVLAEDAVATLTQPPFSASAMDGYAVRREDAVVGKKLVVTGMAPAGHPFVGCVKYGDAVRIFTGSVMPALADHVVIQENVTVETDPATGLKTLTITETQNPPAHIRQAGIDFTSGDILLARNERLGPIHLSVLASANIETVKVTRRPKVCLFANGDELRPVGSQIETGQIISSTPFSMTALIESWGGDVDDLGIIPDTETALQEAIKTAQTYDIIVPLGGASVGDFDLVKGAFKMSGFKLVFEKVAVRPGKPTWYGRKGACQVLGLPGNPASGLVCAHLFLKPLIAHMTGRPVSSDPQTLQAKLAIPMTANGPRESYTRARIKSDSTGQLWAHPFSRQDSSLLTPFAKANALIQRRALAPASASGEQVSFISLTDAMDI